MESLNISKLNLSCNSGHRPAEKVSKAELSAIKTERNLSVADIDEDYQCEYKEEIWKNLLEQETDRIPIHLQSPQLEFRGALVQQLRDITKKLGLTMATLHAAVLLLDQFMDAHRLRSDRLTHVALACLSLAAKSEEKFSRAPTLKTLIKTSSVNICGKTFRQLEWMVGQHVRWRLLMPTVVTYAALIAPHVVVDSDLTTRHPKFVRRFKRDGLKLLDTYLDLTLSDARLKVVETVDVGCACVACARADLGLRAWPAWLAELTGRDTAKITPIARLLQRMMQVMKSRESALDNSEVDQGYGSARTTPNLTPTTSPQAQVSPSSSCVNSETNEEHPILNLTTDPCDGETTNENMKYPEFNSANTTNPRVFLNTDPTDSRFGKINGSDPNDFRFIKSNRSLINAEMQPSSMAVKRTLNNGIDVERKRVRLVM